MTLRDLTDIQLENPLISENDMGDRKLPQHVISKLNQSLGKKNFHFNDYSGYYFVESKNNFAIFSNKYLDCILKLKEFALELFKYAKLVEQHKLTIKNVINDEAVISNEHSADAIATAFKAKADFVRDVEESDIYLLSKFLSVRDSRDEEGKNIINKKSSKYQLRNDVFNSVLLKQINFPDSSSNVFGILTYAICDDDNLFDFLENELRESSDEHRLRGGENILYYGAPGTGKSYAANELSKNFNARVFRTLFHPDMQNSDFFGTLKPAVDKNGEPTYKFREGPFSKALRYARDNPSERVHLVIEELNRAMAAAVFGELFQLLDRDDNGTSEYSVDAPSAEFAEWYRADEFKLPSNLWIVATMNSADQGVYPLDTAFRRRWRQIYIPIEYKKAPIADIRISTGTNPNSTTTWRDFVAKLNDFLVDKIKVPEDRLVGPRFLKDSELAEGKLPGKLLIYLWDDLLRHHNREILFLSSIKTYGDLNRAIEDNKPIFNQSFLDTLRFNPSGSQAE